VEQQRAAITDYIRRLPPESFDPDQLTVDNLPVDVPDYFRRLLDALPAAELQFIVWMVRTVMEMPVEQREQCGIETVEPRQAPPSEVLADLMAAAGLEVLA
jgi:hypothetical protein